MTVKWMDWHSCYDESWKGLIHEDAFAHPAKCSRGLIRRIFEHMEQEGWLPPRSRVLDVFGGIGTTAIEGASRGHEVVCCELEERFVTLAKANFDLHRRTWEQFGDPMPVMLHGDSRKVAELVRGHFAAVVGSPPYSTDVIGNKNGIDWEKADPKWRTSKSKETPGRKNIATEYGHTPGQLGAMKPGDVDACIGSPPYAECPITNPPKASGGIGRQYRLGNRGKGAALHEDGKSQDGYGSTDGNLGNLADAGFDAAVGSPPWETGTSGHDEEFDKKRSGGPVAKEYGCTEGQIGNTTGDTFWTASRIILQQVHQLLRPNGYAAWIVKDYIKAKKRVPFCDNWAKLCEACGFEVVARARCWLVKEQTHEGLFGKQTKKTERKSFFRRLHERNVSIAEHWKTIPAKKRRQLTAAKLAELQTAWALLGDEEKQKITPDGILANPEPDAKAAERDAKLIAWEAAGSPPLGDTRIDFEEVIFVRRVGGNGGGMDACVGSPPFADMQGHASMGHPEKHCKGGSLMKHCTTGARDGDHKYGHTPGQLGSMKEGSIEDAVDA